MITDDQVKEFLAKLNMQVKEAKDSAGEEKTRFLNYLAYTFGEPLHHFAEFLSVPNVHPDAEAYVLEVIDGLHDGSSLIDSIHAFLGHVGEKVEELMQDAEDELSDLSDKIGDAVDEAGEKMEEVAEAVMDAVEGAVAKVEDVIEDMLDGDDEGKEAPKEEAVADSVPKTDEQMPTWDPKKELTGESPDDLVPTWGQKGLAAEGSESTDDLMPTWGQKPGIQAEGGSETPQEQMPTWGEKK